MGRRFEMGIVGRRCRDLCRSMVSRQCCETCIELASADATSGCAVSSGVTWSAEDGEWPLIASRTASISRDLDKGRSCPRPPRACLVFQSGYLVWPWKLQIPCCAHILKLIISNSFIQATPYPVHISAHDIPILIHGCIPCIVSSRGGLAVSILVQTLLVSTG